MKTIGLLGGMSWESTTHYYQLINEQVKAQLGGLHSAELVMASVDFAPIEQMQRNNLWQEAGELLGQKAQKLELAGAQCLVICTNTMHKVVPIIDKFISIPVLHIADATAQTICHSGITKVALLGTRFTMQEDFYKNRLKDKFALDVIVPSEQQCTQIDTVIFNELCLGKVLKSSQQVYLETIDELTQRGAQAIILGCTELGMLVHQQDTNVPLFDATVIHAQKAVEWALNEENLM